ncbi:MAG: hypothetical protein KDB07_02210 [Planctomycetes bacterium]|nr:hypothetical protein [Planctomycetota bacterium]
MIDSLPYLLFNYDLPLPDGVVPVHICLNLIDARCIGIATSRAGAIRHMEDTWARFNAHNANQEEDYQCDDNNDDEGGEDGFDPFN